MRLRDFRQRMAERLAEPLPGAAAHLRLAPFKPRPGWKAGVVPPEARRAAALVLVYEDVNGGPDANEVSVRLRLPLTQRSSSLPHHAGQISLPGGAVDEGETIESAALREAHEEIGVVPADVEVLGRLTPIHVVVSNFALYPVVGVTRSRPDFRAHAPEVDRIIEIDIARLCDASCLHMGERLRDGARVTYPYFDLEGLQVWGATGMVLAELGDLIG